MRGCIFVMSAALIACGKHEPAKQAPAKVAVPEPARADASVAQPPDSAIEEPTELPEPPQPGTIVAAHRSDPRLLIADGSGATWVETADNASTIFHVVAGSAPVTAVKLRGEVTALALDGATLYAAIAASDDGPWQIVRVRGGKPGPIASTTGRVALLTADSGAVYWSGGGGSFWRIPLSGGALKTLAENVEYSDADHQAVDARYFYWSNALDDTPERIYRVAKTGGAPAQISEHEVSAWTVSPGGAVYYAGDHAVWKVAWGKTSKVQDGDVRALGVAGERVVVVTDAMVGPDDMQIAVAGTTAWAVRGDDIVQIAVR